MTDPAICIADRDRDRRARRSRDVYAQVSDIGVIPQVADPERRESCRLDLARFISVYQSQVAVGEPKPYGEKQLEAIERIQRCALDGGRFLNALPRGFCKSTFGEAAVLWATLYGHRRYVVFFGASAGDAEQAIDSIKTELAENDLLYADFPEVCHAVRALEGKSQRCHSQTCGGVLTHIEWVADSIVLPSVLVPRGWGDPNAKLDPKDLVYSDASGAKLQTRGLMASSRGMRHKQPDGTQVRPDLCIVDDPQTDESAVSPAQVAKRLNAIRKSILRLGAHGKAVACVMNATAICEGDLVDQLADQKKHPEWQSIRVAMMPALPKRLDDLWLGRYAAIRRSYDNDDPADQARAKAEATAFYAKNRKAMDEGAEVSWPDIPLEPGEISAIQHALNILVDDGDEVFAAECQNEPRRPTVGAKVGDAELIAKKISGQPVGVVPEWASHVCGMIDVHANVLFWTVIAAGAGFKAEIIDYGCFPKQSTKRFSQARAKQTLQDRYKAEKLSVEASIIRGLTELTGELCGRKWETPDRNSLPMSLVLIDTGYKPEEVSTAIARSPHRAVLMGSRGVGFGPVDKPMTEYDMSPDKVRRAGPDPRRPRWYVPKDTRGGVQVVRFDASYWKDFVHARLRVQEGGAGEWRLFGDARTDHSQFAEHLCSQEPVPTTAKGRTVDVWKLRPGHEDHWLDATVGAAVALSVLGVRLEATTTSAPRSRRKRPRGIRHIKR